jgi:hypothetical protein
MLLEEIKRHTAKKPSISSDKNPGDTAAEENSNCVQKYEVLSDQ